MPEASRHAKPKKSAMRFGAPIVAAATLAGVAAALVFLHGGPAASGSSRDAIQATSATGTDSAITDYRVITAFRRYVTTLETRMVRRARTAAPRRHLAALAATRHAQQQAAAQPSASPSPSPSSTPAPRPSGSGGNAAASALGRCIRNAAEGGSYA